MRTEVRVTARLAIWLLAATASSSVGLAQDAAEIRLVVVSADDLQPYRAAVGRGATSALGSRVRVHTLDDGECLPAAGDVVCITSHLRRGHARLVLRASLSWGRGACVPIRREGVVVGHRMLRTRMLELELYDSTGALLGRSSAPFVESDDVATLTARSLADLAPP